MQRTLWMGALFLLAAVLTPGGAGAAGALAQGKIEPQVRALLAQQGQANVLVVLAEQPDVSGAAAQVSKADKGRYVYARLRETADRTQAPLRALLDRMGLRYRAYYVTNVIAIENLDANTAAALAGRPEVGQIAANPAVKLQDPVAAQAAAPTAQGVEWNIQKIGADQLWAAKVRGQGIVVANQDTGVQWDHPALKTKYRGFDKPSGNVNDSYNWWDAIRAPIAGGTNPCGYGLTSPCDDYGHGTHTMGTLVGGAKNNRIGVAPAAKWIACRNMDQGVGRPSTYIECFQFFLAPWDKNGQNPDPSRAPDVISNSWGCPTSEGCMPDSLKLATANVRAAGIFVSVSAGNSGSACATITDPSAIYNPATTVGATNSGDQLAAFSSRGPVNVDGSGRRKPDLAAPGVNVRSSYPNNSYASLSGTSMAAPHVAGAVALLWQALPALRGKVSATEDLLFRSAVRGVTVSPNPNQSCGGTTAQDIPNDLFGYGRLNVWRAYQQGQ